MSRYIHELKDWPALHWDQLRLAELLADVRHQQGRLIGRMEGLGFDLRQQSNLQTLTRDVVKSSEIEGELLDTSQVRSSVARRLGIDIGGLTASDRNVDGVVEMTLDATQRYDRPLTARRLFNWHTALFPHGQSGLWKIRVGNWRDDKNGPMEIVSGPIGSARVHFVAPNAKRLAKEMQAFLKWFESEKRVDPVMKAALAHFWFVTIHPFEDGNGRIGRAVSDMALARSERSPQRFYSMPSQIRKERSAYYSMLERTQRGPLDISPWMEWFLLCMRRAIDGAQTELANIIGKWRFWENLREAQVNPRQRLILNKLLDGFEGKLNSTKYAKIAKCSQDTALRDIVQLLEQGVLLRGEQGGRSTNYDIVPGMMEERRGAAG
jgi:Fic family protein